jgi:hypothetical protein
MNRRRFLGSTAAGLAGLGLAPRIARAAPAAADRKFVFVFASGGWDVTRTFADGFDIDGVDMEPLAERARVGGVDFIDHPARPSVRAFFEQNAADLLVLNGVQVRSIAHEICTMIALTGDTSGFKPDWATILAAEAGARYTLPHLVLGGPSFVGTLGTAVARTGASGQLEALLSGEILSWSDLPAPGLAAPSRALVDHFVSARARGEVEGARSAARKAQLAAFETAHGRARGLKDYRYVMDFATGATLEDRAKVAVDALSVGLSRCVSLDYTGGTSWDTHANNDEDQSGLWEGLFAGLGNLVARLRAAPGATGGSLADETVLVVLSEMGRTPALNRTIGKDHWPYTSMMLMGPGITTGRVLGGWDDRWYGLPVDLASGEVASSGRTLSAEAVGGALLTLGGVDPAAWVSGADPLLGMLG